MPYSGPRSSLPQAVPLLPSASRNTGTYTVSLEHTGSGLLIYTDKTAGSGSVTTSVLAFDPISNQETALLTSAAVTTNALHLIHVHPALTPVASVAASVLVPPVVRVQFVVADASVTFSAHAIVTP